MPRLTNSSLREPSQRNSASSSVVDTPGRDFVSMALPERMIQLQKSAGNQAVNRLMQQNAPEVIQRKLITVADSGRSNHVLWGDATNNIPGKIDGEELSERKPVVIEVMETNVDSAKSKIDQIAGSKPKGAVDNRAIMIGFNRKGNPSDYEKDGKMKRSASLNAYDEVLKGALDISQHLDQKNVAGGSFPMVWSPTDPEGGGYTFPFLETRSRVTLHNGTAALAAYMQEEIGGFTPIMRSMDGDVSDDPLLENKLGEEQWEELSNVSFYKGIIASGGYKWDESPKAEEFWRDKDDERVNKSSLDKWNDKLVKTIKMINRAEHMIRDYLNKQDSKLIYWPEPNTYMNRMDRMKGAEKAFVAGQESGTNAQQRESNYYMKDIKGLKGIYDKALATTKPLKQYFKPLRDLIKSSDAKSPDTDTLRKLVENIRQTHMSPEHIGNMQKWTPTDNSIDSTKQEKWEKARVELVNQLVEYLEKVMRGDK